MESELCHLQCADDRVSAELPRRAFARTSDIVSQLFRLPRAATRDPSVDTWFSGVDDELRRLARPWFEQMRGCGADVRELLHDGHPTACVEDAAFGYVNAFKAHVNVGFFNGAALDDPAGLLEGSGRTMRHVKLRWGQPANAAALRALIAAAYRDMRSRLRSSR
jgi:uncharacterized protein DUF1801